MADSIGAMTSMLLEPNGTTFDTSSERYELTSESVRRTSTVIDTDGIRGTRAHHKARTRDGQYTVAGSLTLFPSPADLDLLLPRILGAAEVTTDSFLTADVPSAAVASFGLLFDRDVADASQLFVYAGCWVGAATFRGDGNGLVSLELEIVGVTETLGSPTALPVVALGVAANDVPYHFSDSVLTVHSAATVINSFELRIDNHPEVRFGNSLTATSITFQDRTVSLNVNAPYDLTNDSHYLAADAAGTLVLTNGGMSTTFTLGMLQAIDSSPTVGGKGPVTMDLSYISRMTASTAEIAVTHDPVV